MLPVSLASIFSNVFHNPVLSSFMAYNGVCNKSNTMGATGYTRRTQTHKNNPEKLATSDAQDEYKQHKTNPEKLAT
jgi:uncharacterized sodium:solute symporter family permease YidK